MRTETKFPYSMRASRKCPNDRDFRTIRVDGVTKSIISSFVTRELSKTSSLSIFISFFILNVTLHTNNMMLHYIYFTKKKKKKKYN